ncbi:MAG: ABC transporter ATP-binding protein [Clostridiales bacterium]|nr:ABC transporter ATP-binding protein [Clostridiales bacterium]
MQKSLPILQVENLHVKFHLRGKILHAIRGVELEVYPGESLAIVGESGSGKSVLNKNFIGLLDSNGFIPQGSIRYFGKDFSKIHKSLWKEDEKGRKYVDLATLSKEKQWKGIRGCEICMVPQDPMTSLNPLKRIGAQIAEALRLHRDFDGRQIKKEVLKILEDVQISDPEKCYKQYPHELSGGMRQRIVIAIAIACRPQILICDEPTTALDVTIHAQILQLLKKIKKKYQLTIIFITHDLGVVANIAERVAVMYGGDVVEIGLADEVFYQPKHPYTWALLSSLPQLAVKGEELYSIKGSPPNLFSQIQGDAFANRNPYALAIDHIKQPPYFDVTPTHKARTWLLDQRAPKVEPPSSIRKLQSFGGISNE